MYLCMYIYRKSFHGYPAGMAQLIDSPTEFHIQPMQIDTKNRHYNGSDFKPDLLPKSSQAPLDASYSGLIECPCTTRIKKVIGKNNRGSINGRQFFKICTGELFREKNPTCSIETYAGQCGCGPF